MRIPSIILLCLLPSAASAVTLEPDVVYAVAATNGHSGDTRDLRLDVYHPAAATGSALVLIHGGGFTGGTRTSADMVQAATYFAQRGWTCFSIDYRLTTDDPPAPALIELIGDPVVTAAYAATVDTKRAIRWLRAQAVGYGVDTNRIAALGHSAGAYCTLMAAITDESDFPNDTGLGPPDQWAAHRANLNAAVEVSGGIGTNGLGLAGEFDAADPPLMIWHGDSDNTVPYAQALLVQSECLDHHIPYRLHTLAGKDHGQPTWTALYDGQGLLPHALDFLDLFFALRLDLALTSTTVTLTWPSLSNAVYTLQSTPALAVPFTNTIPVTAATDTCSTPFPRPPSQAFYRLTIQSGQTP